MIWPYIGNFKSSAPTPAQFAPNPVSVNMSPSTSKADPDISCFYSTLDKVLYTMFPNTSTQSQDLFKDCQLSQSPGLR